MKRIFIVGGLVLTLVSSGDWSHAQIVIRVRGKVVEFTPDMPPDTPEDQLKPIQGAEIRFESLDDGARLPPSKSNKKGEFIQILTGSGRYKLTVKREGYYPFENADINFRGQSEYDLNLIRLAPARTAAGQVLDETAIQREKEAAEMFKRVKGDFEKAVELSKLQQYDEAKAIYQKIIAEVPLLNEAHFNLGVVYLRTRDFENAESCFQKAIELNPETVEPYLALGEVFQNSAQYDKAIEILAKGREKFPDNVLIQFSLGLAYFSVNRLPEAQEAFLKASELDPDYAEDYFYLGSIAVSNNEVAKAVEYLEKYLAMNPTHPHNVATAQALLPEMKKLVKK